MLSLFSVAIVVILLLLVGVGVIVLIVVASKEERADAASAIVVGGAAVVGVLCCVVVVGGGAFLFFGVSPISPQPAVVMPAVTPVTPRPVIATLAPVPEIEAARIVVEPERATINLDEPIEVAIVAGGATDLYGIEIHLNYEDGLAVEGLTPGTCA